MHWFWRVTIAMAIGAVCGVLLLIAVARLLTVLVPDWAEAMLVILTFATGALAAIVTYTSLTRRYSPEAILERETRCRKCQYILRGITEPRCPECGERI